MVEDHPYGQDILGFMQHHNAVVLFDPHPQFLELGKIFIYGIVQREFSLLNQFGNRHTAESFGLRALHKDIVHLDGAFGRHIGIPDAAGLLHAVFVKHADGAGQFSPVYIGLQHLFCKFCLGINDFLLGFGRQAECCQQQQHYDCQSFHCFGIYK